jgi:8-oxo-dGTP diphosphatase
MSNFGANNWSDYPHALVRLNFCKVVRWQGQMQMREGRKLCVAKLAC